MGVSLDILRKIATGTLSVMGATAQGIGEAVAGLYVGKYGGLRGRKFYPSDMSKVLERLKRQGYIRLASSSTGFALRLTPEGQVLLAQYELKGISIKKSKRWDGKWRVIVFDVKEQRRYLRDRVRMQLQEWGFYMLQKSVFVYPYPCEDVVELLKTGHKVRHDLLYLTVSEMPYDNKLRKHFGFPLTGGYL